ncbi:hypothetical protein JM18_004045 [Phytophthora kernoviae]|uniref:Major facilitator superfamily (MFS) profile domain-containing protein n=2 Tax=Phytophthora kernoviae TaxID=325452 RepID=A0A922AQ03_9STRA|nr:hypothetical protein G195_008846 [Phytophthora kernoviae 00238/432]KAG2527010.1 hypothetical protein JM18_004045 [Phytophthora kernoviae]
MFGLTFSRWYLFIAAFVIQFCIGCIYAWSVLNHPIDLAVYGDATKGRAVNAFYIAIGVFGAATSTMGPTIERKGPQWGVFVGTVLYMIGHIVTALGCHYESITWIYIGYGVITAIGMGMCYISPVSTLQKWFPDYRGTAAGFAVAGYGAGSVVWSKVYLPTIDAVGLAWMFVLLGAIMSAAMFTSALVLRLPPADYTVNGLNIHGDIVDESEGLEDKISTAYREVQTPRANDEPAKSPIRQLTLKQALLTPDFIFMYIMFFGNQLFGVIVLSRLSSMCTEIFNKSAGTASDIVSINSAFNCCGRLAFPVISDCLVRFFKVEKTFARKVLYYFTLGAQVIVLGSLPTVIRHDSYTVFIIMIFVLTCSYGGGFGTIPAFVTDMFGAYNIGPMHGIILTAMAIGGVAGGLSFNAAYNNKVADGMSVGEAYIDNIQIIFVVVCIGFAVLFLVRTNVKDRFEPGYHYSLCGKRVISIPPKDKAAKESEGETDRWHRNLTKFNLFAMFGLTFSRWYLFIAAFVVQFCIGCIYSWSVLNHPIDFAVYGDATKGRAVNTFYIAMGVFGTAAAILGPTIERKGPTWAVCSGTILFMTGHIVSALGCQYKSIALIYIGYGVITAIGLGMCYVSPVSTLQKWFPDYRGTAAGFAVAGSGAGSVVWSKVYLPTIDAVGLPWFFIMLGAIMSAAMFTSGLVLRVPPPNFTVHGLNIHGNVVDESEGLEDKISTAYREVQTPRANDEPAKSPIRQLTLKQALLTPDYIFMYIMFFANQLFGVIVLSRLSSMCTDIFDKSANAASDIVSINSVFNCCGRLAFSAISDCLVRYFKVEKTFARKVLYYFTLGAQVIVLGSLPTVIRHESYSVFVFQIFVLTCSYGGGVGTIPAFVTDMYGAYNIGPMHGVILTAMAIGSVVGGLSFNSSYNDKVADGMSVGEAYIDNIQIIFVVVCIGFAVLFLVRTNAVDRFEPGYHYSLFGKRVISIPPKEKDAEKEGEAETEYEKLPESTV